MKEIKKERTVYDIYYEAIDGTQFYSKEECQKYENTACAVLRERFLKLVIQQVDEFNFFNIGYDANTVYAVKMNTEEDMEAILQYYYLVNSDIFLDEELKQKAYVMAWTAHVNNDLLLVEETDDGDIYFINTRDALIEKLRNIDHKEQ